SIGRRYARMDEIGTPYCITVDYDSLEQDDVTLRDRDTTKQARVAVKNLRGTLQGLLEGTTDFDAL
ncbi:MAG: glycine--tRNA ligase, partial [Candidatus Thermoplasmatota archaeon]|nr:glycine--tRNA ligase [Candidatus Thermoplasmatota archaeon]